MTYDFKKALMNLKKEKNACILAHNYQAPEIQDVADFVGDSFELALKSKTIQEDTVLFCGVHFMAESCKLLAPEKKVIIPSMAAGCSLADSISPEEIVEFKKKNPTIPVVTYINSTAEVKAVTDICCTSGNAVDIINSIDADRVMFVPDANLGSWVQDYTDKELILWEGYCHVHHRVSVEDILRVKAVHENAFMIAHPECRYEVTQMADVVCSTSKMKQAAEQAEPDTIIVVTEGGILHRLKDEVPDKTFVLASSKLVCSYMKENTPELLFETLELGNNEILLSKDIMKKASLPLERMLELTAGGGQS